MYITKIAIKKNAVTVSFFEDGKSKTIEQLVGSLPEGMTEALRRLRSPLALHTGLKDEPIVVEALEMGSTSSGDEAVRLTGRLKTPFADNVLKTGFIPLPDDEPDTYFGSDVEWVGRLVGETEDWLKNPPTPEQGELEL